MAKIQYGAKPDIFKYAKKRNRKKRRIKERKTRIQRNIGAKIDFFSEGRGAFTNTAGHTRLGQGSHTMTREFQSTFLRVQH